MTVGEPSHRRGGQPWIAAQDAQHPVSAAAVTCEAGHDGEYAADCANRPERPLRLRSGEKWSGSFVCMGIRDADIDAVRAATDLVAVIGQHTEVKRSGRQWMARCPIHGERTPSLSISPEKGVWYCFGCQRSGDAITFVREVEGLDFVGAVERLAAAAGIVVERTGGDDRSRRRRRRLLELIDAAAGFYHEQLLEASDADDARRYLAGRGIDTNTIAKYRIGWAPDNWDRLVVHLSAGKDDTLDAGLGFVSKNGRLCDFFRGRVLFPVRDERGATVGFGGRVLPGGDGPKYINTPNSCRVYDKSRVLYGLYEHRRQIVKEAQAVVCEGYTDVIGCAVAGLSTAVAPCGTAMTEEHIKLLRRFSAERLVLTFDADAAGATAAARLHEWEHAHTVRMLVAQLPEGADPGSLAYSDPGQLVAATETPVEMLRWRVERSLTEADLSTIGNRAAAAAAAARIVADHPDPMVRDPFLMEIARRCSVDPSHLRAAAAAARSGDTGPDLAAGTTASTVVGVAEPVSEAEAEAVRLALHHGSEIAGWLQPELFCDPVCGEAFGVLRDCGGDVAAACAAATPPASGLLARLAAIGPGKAAPADVEGVMAGVARLAAQRAIRALVADTATSTDPARSRHLADCVTWLKQRTELLSDHTPSRSEALRELLPWLVEHRSAQLAALAAGAA